MIKFLQQLTHWRKFTKQHAPNPPPCQISTYLPWQPMSVSTLNSTNFSFDQRLEYWWVSPNEMDRSWAHQVVCVGFGIHLDLWWIRCSRSKLARIRIKSLAPQKNAVYSTMRFQDLKGALARLLNQLNPHDAFSCLADQAALSKIATKTERTSNVHLTLTGLILGAICESLPFVTLRAYTCIT